MHVVVLRAKSGEELQETQKTLVAAGIVSELFVEQPENIPTALALVPCARARLGRLLRRFPLFR